MNRSVSTALLAVSGLGLLALAGCDTSLDGSYRPYQPTTPAAVVWPSPAGPAGAVPPGESDDQARTAGYSAAPATRPATTPTE